MGISRGGGERYFIAERPALLPLHCELVLLSSPAFLFSYWDEDLKRKEGANKQNGSTLFSFGHRSNLIRVLWGRGEIKNQTIDYLLSAITGEEL